MSTPAKIIEFPAAAQVAIVPESARFDAEVPVLVERALAVRVVDQDSLTAANEISILLTKSLREVEETFDPIIDHFHKGHKMSLSTKARYAGPISEALRIIKADRIGGYLAEQDRKAKEAREAAWRAEQEKIRLQQESIRKAQEAERKAAEEKRLAEEKSKREAAEADAKASRARTEEGRRKAQEEADRIRREAAAEAQEKARLAAVEQDRIMFEAAADRAAIEESIPAQIEKPQTEGISLRYDWDCEVVEAKLVPRDFLMVDESKLRKYAKAMKDDANVSGVRFFKKPVTSQRVK
jgi:hypothetical protein